MKKALLLFLALLLPVLIFVFLKSFGKNEFEVPVLFTDSVSIPPACTAYTYATPYRIADSVLQKIEWKETDSLTLVVLDDTIAAHEHERAIHLNRVKTAFKTESYRICYVSHAPREINNDQVYVFSETELLTLRKCVLLMNSIDDVVIIDSKKQIRGQYNLQKREDADRMIMQEMNILFKRY